MKIIPADRLAALLAIETIDQTHYRAPATSAGDSRRLFGGQAIAQALVAAQRTVFGKKAHSLHAYFMRPGRTEEPISYSVECDFDGEKFAKRRVFAVQAGGPILSMALSFQVPEQGLMHQIAMPDVPPPDALESDQRYRKLAAEFIPAGRGHVDNECLPIEIRPVEPLDWIDPQVREARRMSWVRARTQLGDDPAQHQAILAYISDMTLISAALMPHGISWMTPNLQLASLDHAIWLHGPFRADDWLLYCCDSEWSGHGRGLAAGRFFTRDGRLIASVTQEGLMRLRGESRVESTCTP